VAIPPNAPSSATPAIRAVWAAVYDRWPRAVSSAGVTVCKQIEGSSTWSQHSWGNAWDITGTTTTLDRVAAFLRSADLRPVVAQVLWRVPDHYGHIHVSGRPMFSGVPPCAGGSTSPQQYPGTVAPVSIPTRGELIGSESWAPIARAASRELLRRADRIGRIPGMVGRILSRG
jgi:hypothetical protein